MYFLLCYYVLCCHVIHSSTRKI